MRCVGCWPCAQARRLGHSFHLMANLLGASTMTGSAMKIAMSSKKPPAAGSRRGVRGKKPEPQGVQAQLRRRRGRAGAQAIINTAYCSCVPVGMAAFTSLRGGHACSSPHMDSVRKTSTGLGGLAHLTPCFTVAGMLLILEPSFLTPALPASANSPSPAL